MNRTLDEGEAAATMPRFACFLRPPTSDPRPVSAEVLAAHTAYLHQLLADGRLVAAGLLDDPREGLMVFDAVDLEHARAIAAADPAVADGGRQAIVRQWNVEIERSRETTSPT
ncbi:unannotated protein [freshwater metagenome]|uniref:Unannotated protein n=1 Tax=freshwater metagenome TaxID=449393 RepID=A0A6J7EYI1_9ZZZZ|nr:hypothetical protein [Actinomycetota bacterium]